MKQVVALNGSPREQGNTQALLEEIAALLAPHGIEVTILGLAGTEIADCTGCQCCVRKTGVCHQEDDAAPILERIQAADAVILGSPVYVMSVPGRLKALIDKTASWVHRPPLVGKPLLSVVSTEGSGLKDVQDYLDLVGIQWGAHPAGRVGRTAQTRGEPVTLNEVADFLWHLSSPTDRWRPTFYQLTWFAVQKVLALKVARIDREFWEARGWDQALYYFPCRIGPVRRLVAALFYRWMYSRVRNVNPY